MGTEKWFVDPTIYKDPKEKFLYWFRFFALNENGMLEPRTVYARDEENCRELLQKVMNDRSVLQLADSEWSDLNV